MRRGKLPQALKHAVMAPDIVSNSYRVIARVLPRSRPSCRQSDALNLVSPTTGVTRSQFPGFATNGIVQGHDPHAGTLRSTPLNRDLAIVSASLPNPGALVLWAAVYRKQDAIACIQLPCALTGYEAGKQMSYVRSMTRRFVVERRDHNGTRGGSHANGVG